MYSITNAAIHELIPMDVNLCAVDLPSLRTADEAKAGRRPIARNKTQVLLGGFSRSRIRAWDLYLQYSSPVQGELGKLLSDQCLPWCSLAQIGPYLKQHRVRDLQISNLWLKYLDIPAELLGHLFALDVAIAERMAPS